MTISKSKIYQAIQMFILQEGRCYYCKSLLWEEGKELQDCNIDHKLPASRGGGNGVENLALSCVSCNTEKGSMNEEEYKAFLYLKGSGGYTKKELLEFAQYIGLKKKFSAIEAPSVVSASMARLPAAEDINKLGWKERRKLEVKELI